jgi:hypothetical protein
MRALLGFVSGALSVLLVHQTTSMLFNASGFPTDSPFGMNPTQPLGVPRLFSRMFWGGLYGLAFGLALPRLRGPLWLWGFGVGMLAIVVAAFVVAPLKGRPMASGFTPTKLMLDTVIDGLWGIGIALFLGLFVRIAARRERKPV